MRQKQIREDTSTIDAGINSWSSQDQTRRSFMRMGALLSLTAFIGCTPYRILLKKYPKRFKSDRELIDTTLRSFVVTVIPGADMNAKNLVRVFYDDFYPFYKYTGYFAFDLCEKSENLYGVSRFDQLDFDQRTLVIEQGERGGKIKRKIYQGAILLAQISFFAGIYDDDKGCQLIDFQGKNYGYSPRIKNYEENTYYLSYEMTKDGNCS